MSIVSRGTRWAVGCALLASILLGLLATGAQAAPNFSVGLRSDANEVQALTVEATTGQFRLEFKGVETADLAATASAAEIEAALNSLATIAEGGGSVGVVQAAAETGRFLVTFSGGPLAAKLQPLMTTGNGTTPLGGSTLGGGPALAYVSTSVPGGISRSDERTNYVITAKNTASAVVGNPVVGSTLGCNGAKPNKNWTPAALATRPSSFSFEWRRNGVAIGGATDPAYVTTAADEGKVIQCLVTGKSADKKSAAKYASLPAAIVDPQPATTPPAATTPTAASSRPTITPAAGGVGVLRTCTAPTGVTGTPTWTFQWLRNGEPISGANVNATATTSQYTPVEADSGTRLQCEALATNAGGALVTTSEGASIGTVASPPVLAVAQTPNIVIDATSPRVELDLPSGTETHLFTTNIPKEPNGTNFVASNNYWTCVEVPTAGPIPAKAVCTNPNVYLPGAEIQPIEVGVKLGADAPTQASTVARIAGVGVTTPATAPFDFAFEAMRPFGIIPGRFSAEALGATGDDFTQAGGHPALARTNISFNRLRTLEDEGLLYNRHRPIERVRDIAADIPPGFIGNPQAVPDLCPSTSNMVTEPSTCPPGSVVGEVAFQANKTGTAQNGLIFKRMALYAMVPEEGVPAQFAAAEPINDGVYVLIPRLRPDDGYAISIDSLGTVEDPEFLDLRVTLCSYGATTVLSGSTTLFGNCKEKGDPGAFTKPFLTSQTECVSSGPVTSLHVDSWPNPGVKTTANAVAPKMTGCDLVPFEPKLDLEPTTKQAESASGLDVDLTIPTDGFEDPDELTQAHLKRTTVTLPAGMSLNPSAADGLGACTQAQLGMVNGVPNNEPVQCPPASKIGTALVKTPILEEPLEGSIYLAKQGDNPFGTLVGIYVVVQSKERGVLIKLPGRVDVLPGGQLVSTFDDNPQAPFSSLELSFNSGPRAALMTPQRCGSYEIVSELTPWSAADPDNPTPAETVTQKSSFQVTSGPGGGACPNGSLLPKLKAGITNPTAGASSPFVLTLSRDDGTQRFDGLTMTLPPGLAANLSGVPYCSDTTLASIPTAEGTGAAEIANPSCPAASRIGSVSVGAGAGSPFYVHGGSAYLAGPYKGAPLSLAVVVPAVAGPFDLGNVVVRSAVTIDPRTAQVSIKSDPLPTQLHNLPIDVRDVRVTVDRPGFIQAPTNCEEMRIDAVVSGDEGGDAPVSNRFQVGECGNLDFGPQLKLYYKGATKRTGNPGLRAVLTQPAGEANISSAQVILPRGSFIDNAHINNPCTRAQYAANACPASSILGTATAWSPLLDQPLSGYVYFRSNGGERELPDIVAKLQGQVDVELVGYVDAVVNKRNGVSRVRNTFAIVPDAPVTRFELNMKGGKVGLIENSKDLCKGANKATVKMTAHNGDALNTSPVVRTDCRKKKGGKAGKRKKAERSSAAR